MILGLLSDTHGQRQRARLAVRLLQERGATAFVHCGDVGGAGVLEELAGLRAWVVWGNVDDPTAGLVRFAESLGVTVAREVPLRIELDGRVLGVGHGHEPVFSRLETFADQRDARLLRGPWQGCHYVLHGHTHVPRDERVGPLRFINPGALHRASPPTVATLDLATDTVGFWQVFDDPAKPPPTRYHPD